MDLSGKLFDPRVRFFDIVSQAGTWSQSRIAQPIVTNHAALIHIRDRARFELPHFRKGPLGTRAHRLQKIIGKWHPTDVDRETDIVIAQKIPLEALPKRVHQLELTRIFDRRKGGLRRDVEWLNRFTVTIHESRIPSMSTHDANDEIRMTKLEGMIELPNDETNALSSRFEFSHSFVIRHSCFVILPHICSIMLSPNCEHLISVAPSIKRAKSYVTRLLSLEPLNPLSIRGTVPAQP